MSRPHLHVAGRRQTDRDIEAIISDLALRIAMYDAPTPAVVDGSSYQAGFRAGVRSMAADVINRLRDLDREDVG